MVKGIWLLGRDFGKLEMTTKAESTKRGVHELHELARMFVVYEGGMAGRMSELTQLYSYTNISEKK